MFCSSLMYLHAVHFSVHILGASSYETRRTNDTASILVAGCQLPPTSPVPNFQNKWIFNKHTIKDCISCSWQCSATVKTSGKEQKMIIFALVARPEEYWVSWRPSLYRILTQSASEKYYFLRGSPQTAYCTFNWTHRVTQWGWSQLFVLGFLITLMCWCHFLRAVYSKIHSKNRVFENFVIW